jgi:hypothetical protein
MSHAWWRGVITASLMSCGTCASCASVGAELLADDARLVCNDVCASREQQADALVTHVVRLAIVKQRARAQRLHQLLMCACVLSVAWLRLDCDAVQQER